jgi:hypothetical protein
MDVKGKLVQALDIESGTSGAGKAWQKRINIFDIPSGNYTDKLAVTFFGDNAKPELKVGFEYLLSFNVKSREANGRWYTEATIWKWSAADGAANEAADKAGVSPQLKDGKKFYTPSDARNASINSQLPIPEPDDLPFMWAIPLIPFAGALASVSLFC